jgi:hypothetical protein
MKNSLLSSFGNPYFRSKYDSVAPDLQIDKASADPLSLGLQRRPVTLVILCPYHSCIVFHAFVSKTLLQAFSVPIPNASQTSAITRLESRIHSVLHCIHRSFRIADLVCHPNTFASSMSGFQGHARIHLEYEDDGLAAMHLYRPHPPWQLMLVRHSN